VAMAGRFGLDSGLLVLPVTGGSDTSRISASSRGGFGTNGTAQQPTSAVLSHDACHTSRSNSRASVPASVKNWAGCILSSFSLPVVATQDHCSMFESRGLAVPIRSYGRGPRVSTRSAVAAICFEAANRFCRPLLTQPSGWASQTAVGGLPTAIGRTVVKGGV